MTIEQNVIVWVVAVLGLSVKNDISPKNSPFYCEEGGHAYCEFKLYKQEAKRISMYSALNGYSHWKGRLIIYHECDSAHICTLNYDSVSS